MNMGAVLDAIRSDARLFDEATVLFNMVQDMMVSLSGK